MRVIHKISEVREIIREERNNGKKIGLVPTMGALHKGHLSLINESVKRQAFTVISVFVNPIQFGPNEDYEKYPRNLEKDAMLVESTGADLLFNPAPDEILGKNLLTFVDIDKLGNNLCGAKRPGHFRGVCTIVTKLFNVVTPDYAFFGQKDVQQLTIIKKMAEDLNFNIEIIKCPTVREDDGLAMSSRNMYLSKSERQDALILSKAIKEAVRMISQGEQSSKNVINDLINLINSIKSAKIDYIKFVNKNMEDIDSISDGNILALAVYIGKTRLIDNHIIGEKICF